MCHDVTSASLQGPVVPKKFAEESERSGVRVDSDSFFNRSVFKRHRRNHLKMATVSVNPSSSWVNKSAVSARMGRRRSISPDTLARRAFVVASDRF